MKRYLLLSSIVKPFYRQNAGLLCFVYYIMLLTPGQANGVGAVDYHYSLIRGMLGSYSFLMVVHALWIAYAIRCCQFVVRTLQQPEYTYLYMLALVDRRRLLSILLQAHVMIFLPVLTYVLIIIYVGYPDHFYLSTSVVLISNSVMCLLCVLWYRHKIFSKSQEFASRVSLHVSPKYFPVFLCRYVMAEGKVLFFLLKVLTCGTLYLLLRERDPANETDLRLPVFFYCTAVLTHSILIHRMKDVENWRLSFYRSLPISLGHRFAGYAFFYLLLFIPEVMMTASLTPDHLPYVECCFFLFFGYGLLLMLNSLQLYNYSGLRQYLQTIVQFFAAFALALIPGWYMQFSIIIFILAVVLFLTRYYHFEPYPNNVMR